LLSYCCFKGGHSGREESSVVECYQISGVIGVANGGEGHEWFIDVLVKDFGGLHGYCCNCVGDCSGCPEWDGPKPIVSGGTDDGVFIGALDGGLLFFKCDRAAGLC
jgi:hypothetical protein